MERIDRKLFLLDTHALIWWLVGDNRLSKAARESIIAPEHGIFVSAASAWEISTKYRLGKLPSAHYVASNISRCIADQGFKELAITVNDAQRAGFLKGMHRDPFDRLLIVQAKFYGLILITNDSAIRQYDVEVLW